MTASLATSLADALAHHERGNLAQAEQLYQRILEIDPTNADALHLFGAVCLQRGQPRAAVAWIERALGPAPNDPAMHANLGEAYRALGDCGRAAASYQRALDLQSDNADAAYNFGLLLMQEGQIAAAAQRFAQALRGRPDFDLAHNNLGNVYRLQGDVAAALHHFGRAVELNPRLGLAHGNLGQLLLECERPHEALGHCREAVRLEPESAAAHNNLGNVLRKLGQLADAQASYLEALRLEPRLALAHKNLGELLLEQGRPDEARPWLVPAALPIAPAVLCRLAEVYLELDRSAEALECARAALAADPACAMALALLARHLRDRLPADDEAAMHRLLGSTALADAERACLLFGLAQVEDARRDYAAAARHAAQANQLESRFRNQAGRAYDPAAHHAFIDRLLTVFSPDFFARVRGMGLDSERPVFIVGLPRSGTSLLEQVLASHPHIHGAGELLLARADFEQLGGGSDGAAEARAFTRLETVGAATLRQLGHLHLERLSELDGDAERIVDKMPDNYQYLGLLTAIFPRARFLHCRRDLRDVAVSCWLTQFRDIPWANDFAALADRFAHYRRVMAHWHAVLPVPVHDVSYEEMVADLEGVARRVVAYLGLEWEPQCLEFHRNRRPVRTASLNQVRQPIYRHALARWRSYESALQPVFELLNRSCGGTFL